MSGYKQSAETHETIESEQERTLSGMHLTPTAGQQTLSGLRCSPVPDKGKIQCDDLIW